MLCCLTTALSAAVLADAYDMQCTVGLCIYHTVMRSSQALQGHSEAELSAKQAQRGKPRAQRLSAMKSQLNRMMGGVSRNVQCWAHSGGPRPAQVTQGKPCGRAETLGRTVHSRFMGYSTLDIREKALG